MFQGSIDKITADGAAGWFYSSLLDTKPNMVAWLDNRVVGQAPVNSYRPDLEKVGFGDGRCGFEIKFAELLSESLLPFVSIRPEGSSLSLPFTHKNLLLDIVASLNSSFPGAGRNRSVIGGLWTDRTDALQILAGRIAIETCTVDVQPQLREFIADGYVVMREIFDAAGLSDDIMALIESVSVSGGMRSGSSDMKKSLTEIASLLYGERIVALLRAIFDDHPVIYAIELVEQKAEFAQLCSFELFPSPAECVALYVACPGARPRLEAIRDSHELPEFTAAGLSRWTAAGAEDLSLIAKDAGSSVIQVEVEQRDVVLVGPGLIHQVPEADRGKLIRIICAPRRQTPIRFLENERTWNEASHLSGARIRL